MRPFALGLFAWLAGCGTKTSLDVGAPARTGDSGSTAAPTPLACATSFDRCVARFASPRTISGDDEVASEAGVDIAAIDAQRFVVVYNSVGRTDVSTAIVDDRGSVTERGTIEVFDRAPRVTFHPGFSTGVIRTGVTTTIIDADGRGNVTNVIASPGPDLAQPVVPVSLGYVTWSSTDGRGSFYRTRASSRGLEWEAVGVANTANGMVSVQRSQGLPRALILGDSAAASLYRIDDDGRVTASPTLARIPNTTGVLLGAVETERGTFLLLQRITGQNIALVDVETGTAIETESGARYGDVLSLDDGSIVLATAAGVGGVSLRALPPDGSRFGASAVVLGSGDATRMRLVLTRTGFAMVWMARGVSRRSVYLLQRWDCCPG